MVQVLDYSTSEDGWLVRGSLDYGHQLVVIQSAVQCTHRWDLYLYISPCVGPPRCQYHIAPCYAQYVLPVLLPLLLPICCVLLLLLLLLPLPATYPTATTIAATATCTDTAVLLLLLPLRLMLLLLLVLVLILVLPLVLA